MGDDELAALRAKRMAEMQASCYLKSSRIAHSFLNNHDPF